MDKISENQRKYLRKLQYQKIGIHSVRIFLCAAFLIIWEYASSTNQIDSFIFSSPSKVVTCFFTMIHEQDLFSHISVTLYETLISFILVMILSVCIATLFWLFPILWEIADPYMVILNSLPKSALAPLLIVWLGATTKTIIIAGISVALFGSIMNLYTAYTSIDPEKIKLIYTLHGNQYHALTKVVFPSSLPSLLNIGKVNIGLCLVGVIIGEFLAAKKGLGYLIIYSSQTFKLDWLILSILILCMIAISLYFLLSLLEKVCKKKY